MNDMIEVKAVDLIGPALRYALAIATGFKVKRLEEGDYAPGEPHWWMVYDEARVTPGRNGLVGYIHPKPRTSIYSYHPDLDWSQGGQLIEMYRVQLEPGAAWAAKTDCGGGFTSYVEAPGHTALIAACRAIVACKLGETVKVPKELVQ